MVEIAQLNASAVATVEKWSAKERDIQRKTKEGRKFAVALWEANAALMRREVAPDWKLVRLLGKTVDHFDQVVPPEPTAELTRRDQVDVIYLRAVFAKELAKIRLEAKFGRGRHEFAYEPVFSFIERMMKEPNIPPEAIVTGMTAATNALFLVVCRRWQDMLRAIVSEVEELSSVEGLQAEDVMHLDEGAKNWAKEVLELEQDWPVSLMWTSVQEYPTGLFACARAVQQHDWWDFAACYAAIGACKVLEARLFESLPDTLRHDRETAADLHKLRTLASVFEHREKSEEDSLFQHTTVSRCFQWKRVEYADTPDLESFIDTAIRSESDFMLRPPEAQER